MQPLLVNNVNRLCCVNFLLTKYVATIYDKWIICFSLVMYTRFHTFDFCFLRGILLNIRSLLIDFNINGVYSINCQYYIVQCRSVLRRKSSWCAIGSTRRVRGDRDLQSWRIIFSNTVQPRRRMPRISFSVIKITGICLSYIVA